MLATATHPDPYPAAGLLTAQAISRRLNRRRLPSYRAIARQLFEVVGFRLHVSTLWREIFDQPMPDEDPFDAFITFVQKVDRELFPVHLLYMDDLLYNVETWQDLVCYPIPYIGYGVPWEVECFSCLEPWAQPMVAALDIAGVIGDAGTINYDSDDYWERLGYDEIPDLAWLRNVDRAVEMLKQLPPPYDGLAAVYHAVCKNTDNLFIAIPSPGWTFEYYMQDDSWDVAEIAWFAEMYAAGQDDVEALGHYFQWFAHEPNAARLVMDTLISLEENAPPQLYPISGRPLVEVIADLEEDE